MTINKDINDLAYSEIKNMPEDKLKNFLIALHAYQQGVKDAKELINFDINKSIDYFDKKIDFVKKRLEELKNEQR